MNKLTMSDLRQRQSLPLEAKIIKSIRTLEDFYDMYDGEVFISKGGVDSTVVEHLAKQSKYKNIESVCVASVEPTENIRHNFELGNTLLKSPVSKKEVITDWGYPLVSKKVAMAIDRYNNTEDDYQKKIRLYGYEGRNGKWIYDGRIPVMYQELIYAPFDISNKCCYHVKEKALIKYGKVNNLVPITGEIAEESRDRLKNYLKHGCIMFEKGIPKCTPLGFWTKQDIMMYIKIYNVPISKAYGDIIEDEDGLLIFSGEQRTGCNECAFGVMVDEDRFDRLKKNKPYIYRDMMEGGKWIEKEKYRPVKFTPNSEPVWSNKYWVPSEEGYGYKFVLNYFYEVMGIDKRIA